MAPKGASSFLDTSGSPFAHYSYRVRALGTPAPSAYSNTASVVLDAGAKAPRLRLTGSGHLIADGSTAPSWTTSTDFGVVSTTGTPGSVSNVYTIQNIGNATLDLTLPLAIAGANPGDFSVATPPPATVAPGATATFQLTFAPTAAGHRTADIQITSDDPDQSPYTFTVGGQAVGDLVGYWMLDETSGQTAFDSSGEDNNGTTNAVAWVAGHTNGAGSFNGATSYITVPDSASLDPYALTVAAWIDPVDWNGNRRILQKGAGDNQYRLLAEAGVLKFDIAGVGTVTAALPAVNVWTHVAGTYDGAALRLYVNGVQAASTAATAPMPATGNPLIIGSKSAGGAQGDHFNGVLDEVRVYWRALSATEISAIAQ
jgi:hypothetical protein